MEKYYESQESWYNQQQETIDNYSNDIFKDYERRGDLNG